MKDTVQENEQIMKDTSRECTDNEKPYRRMLR
jgi:hypothetical protein